MGGTTKKWIRGIVDAPWKEIKDLEIVEKQIADWINKSRCFLSMSKSKI